MSRKYFRKPGQKGTYTKFQTAQYVSRLARSQRGSLLTPTSQKTIPNGYEFGFFSARGPANNHGKWKVTATKNEPVEPDPGNGHYESGAGSVLGGQCAGLNYGAKFRYSYLSRGREIIYTSHWYLAYGPIGRMTWRITNKVLKINWPWYNASGNPLMANYGRTNFRYRFVQTPYFLDIQTLGGAEDNCGSLPWLGAAGGGNGGGGDNGNGKYSYTCTCPDYSKTQPKLFVPSYPSDYCDRSWVKSNAGALPGPPKFCKHIISAVKVLNDGEFLSGVNIGNDLPTVNLGRTHVGEFEQFGRNLHRMNPDWKDHKDFWDDVNRTLNQRRRRRQLNRSLDTISRMRTYGVIVPHLTREYVVEQRGYMDYTGRNMEREQFQRYFNRRFQYTNENRSVYGALST
ncbi:hypothetical protein SPB21_02580 [Leptothoe sp. ISB3NOV94-8A]